MQVYDKGALAPMKSLHANFMGTSYILSSILQVFLEFAKNQEEEGPATKQTLCNVAEQLIWSVLLCCLSCYTKMHYSQKSATICNCYI